MISAFRRTSSSRRWSVLPALLLVTVASCALTDKPSGSVPTAPPAGVPGANRASPVGNAGDGDSVRPAATESLVQDVATPGIDAETARVNQALDRRVPDLNLDGKPFAEVIEQFRQTSDLNIFVNWRALEAAGIDRNAPVTARLRNAKFVKVLRVILDEVGGDTVKLGYSVEDGTVTVTTEEDLNRNTLTKVYDIRDLLTDTPDHAPASDAAAAAQPAPTTQPREKLAEEIIALIQETVVPDAWRENGGSVGAIRELSGQLIITATPSMHDEIAKLLHMIRKARGVQVSVETRFITIDPAALDKALGEKLSSTMGKSGEPTVWQLSDEQVQAVLRAAQRSEHATLVTAPRITLFSGQRGYVNVSTQTAYVSGFNVFKQEGAETRYEPAIGINEAGIFHDVRATASADRRHATLTLKPRLSRLEALRTMPYMDSKDLTIQVPEMIVHELQATLSIPDRGTALIGGFTESATQATAQITTNALTANVGDGTIHLNDANRTKVQIPADGKVTVEGDPIRVTRGAEPTTRPASQNLYVLVKPTLIITKPEEQTR